ncbi:MAG: PfkB family carbohydrate kinase, partial [Chloroflexota bacterium]
DLKDCFDLEKAAQQILRNGARVVIVTQGEKGAFLALPSQVRAIPGFKVEPVDTTAAGDAFNGGLAVALSRGEDMAFAVRYACAVGALAVTRLGAQPSLPTAAEVDVFLRSRI